MWYDQAIDSVKYKLSVTLEKQSDHNLDEKYIASAIRDYCESLRALEQAKRTSERNTYENQTEIK